MRDPTSPSGHWEQGQEQGKAFGPSVPAGKVSGGSFPFLGKTPWGRFCFLQLVFAVFFFFLITQICLAPGEFWCQNPRALK